MSQEYTGLVHMVKKILNSNILAICALGIAAYGVGLLYIKGWTEFSFAGIGLWLVAAMLVLRGMLQQRKEKKLPQPEPQRKIRPKPRSAVQPRPR